MRPADGEVDSLLSRLAEQAMRTAVEPERSRARARFELMMIAARDPELSAVFDGLTDRFVAISEAAVAQVQPAGTPVDQELIKEQAFAVVNFLGGFLFRLAYGLVRLESADKLEGYLHAVIAGVAAEHARIKNATMINQPGVTSTRPCTPAVRTRSKASAIRFNPNDGPNHRRRVDGTAG